MTKPASDHVHFDAGLEQVDGCGVAEDVRTHPAVGASVVKVPGVAPHNLVDPETSQGLAGC